MAVRIAVGGEFFDRIRKGGSYYVDKTELLYELVHGTDNMVTLFTRPRRFGKTLMMSMIENFFDIRRDSKDLFGRPDIKLTDYDNRRALIIEAKKSDGSAQMEHDCEEALKQIVDQEYARGLDAYKVYCYGVAFYQKTALVKKL